ARLGVQYAQRPVETADGQGLAVGCERDAREARFPPEGGPPLAARGHVPEPDRAIAARRRSLRAAGGEGHGLDPSGVNGQLVARPFSPRIGLPAERCGGGECRQPRHQAEIGPRKEPGYRGSSNRVELHYGTLPDREPTIRPGSSRTSIPVIV